MEEFFNNSVLLASTISVIVLLCIVLWYFNNKRRRVHFRFRMNYWAYKLGIKDYISRKNISCVHVREHREPLIDVMQHPKIVMNKETLEEPVMLRKEVAFRLFKVADKMPKNLKLKLYSAYRSRSVQNELWMKAIDETMKENPGIGRAEILQLTRYKATDPKVGLGGHETGGAVDVALCDVNGQDLDLGTKFHEYNDNTKTKSYFLTKEQKQNRSLLIKYMKKQGFVNFPGEWWHFSYGDRAWSAYSGKRRGGIYDVVEKDFDGKYVPVVPIRRVGVEIKERGTSRRVEE